MIQTFKKSVGLGIVALLLWAVVSSPAAHAADLYKDGPPKDADLDGLTDQGEVSIFHTDPNNPDTDGDGFWDGAEVLAGTNPLDKNDPQPQVAAATQTQPKSVPWVWYLTRASGITSYLLLFLLLMTGMGLTADYIYNWFGPIVAWRIHRTLGITLGAFVAIHLVTLALDNYAKFSLRELFIPFYSKFKPLYMSLGIIGFYLLLLIIATSVFFVVTKYKAWRLLHYLTFPAFAALFFHGVFIGTDSGTLVMKGVYWVTGILVALSFFYRLTKIPSRRSNARQQVEKGMGKN